MGSVVRCNQARMLDFVFHPLQTIKASCMFQRYCLVLIMTLKGFHGFRTSCNVPRFARWGDERDVCAAPAPAAEFIAPVPARSVAPEPAARAAPAPVAGYIERTRAVSGARAPVVEHTAPALRASSSCCVRKWRSTPCQIQIVAPAPAMSCVTPTWTKLSLLPRSTKSENQAAVSAVTAAQARSIRRFGLVR